MPAHLSLPGRVALITGGGSGLGRAIAQGFIAEGASVLSVDMNEARNAEAVSALGTRCSGFTADVREEPSAAEAVALAASTFGRLDILVNCAGIARGGSILEMPTKSWHDVLDTHLTASMFWARHAAKAMIAQGTGGKIINIGSMFSIFGAAAGADYATAKSGMLGLTRSLCLELAKYRIQVNALLPGWFKTELTQGLPEMPRGIEIRRKTPAGRWADAEEICGPAVFLASAASDFVTGVALPVDGGYSVCDHLIND